MLVNDGCGGRALPVAGSCTVQVAFDPSADGAASATLGVGGAGLDAAATATLTGSGVSGAMPAPPPPPAPGSDPSSPPGSGPGAGGRLVLGASAPQRRGALARAVATVRVPGPGRLTGTGTVRIGRASRAIGVVPATARRAGTVRLTLTLPAAVRREIARTGRVTSRISLRLAGATAATGARSVRIAAPASRRMARQWIGHRLGPWRAAPRLSARERSGLRISDRRRAWSAVVVR